MIHIFHLRHIGKAGKHHSNPNESWTETIDIGDCDYDTALLEAKKEFIRRQNGYLDGIDYESIEVMDYEVG